jgi:hypothetical protein
LASGCTFSKASTASFIKPWSSETAFAALPHQVQQLLKEFPTLLRPSAATPKPLHGVVHHIDTGSAAPIFVHPQRLDPEKHRVALQELLALEKACIIRCSNSFWASSLHLAPKKDGSWRHCGDYCCLNTVTVPNMYPLPYMQSLNDRMAGGIVFSKIDLVKAYHQIPITEADVPKIAITTPLGNFFLWLLA